MVLELKRHCEKAIVLILETSISIVDISYLVTRISPLCLFTADESKLNSHQGKIDLSKVSCGFSMTAPNLLVGVRY